MPNARAALASFFDIQAHYSQRRSPRGTARDAGTPSRDQSPSAVSGGYSWSKCSSFVCYVEALVASPKWGSSHHRSPAELGSGNHGRIVFRPLDGIPRKKPLTRRRGPNGKGGQNGGSPSADNFIGIISAIQLQTITST